MTLITIADIYIAAKSTWVNIFRSNILDVALDSKDESFFQIPNTPL
jgi:hypothetical protein